MSLSLSLSFSLFLGEEERDGVRWGEMRRDETKESLISDLMWGEMRRHMRWGEMRRDETKRKIETFEIDVIVDNVDGRLLLARAAHRVLLAPL